MVLFQDKWVTINKIRISGHPFLLPRSFFLNQKSNILKQTFYLYEMKRFPYLLTIFGLTLACQAPQKSQQAQQESSVSVSTPAKVGVGAEAPTDAILLFDGSRELLDQNWTYWEGPRLAASLPIKWALEDDPIDEGTVMNSNDPAAAGADYMALRIS